MTEYGWFPKILEHLVNSMESCLVKVDNGNVRAVMSVVLTSAMLDQIKRCHLLVGGKVMYNGAN
jgi:hypothetical protein